MATNRQKILWLVSWYPNRFDLYDGDFIQRHARAASIHNDIHVLFIKKGVIKEQQVEERIEYDGLTEQIIYYKQKEGTLGRVKNLFRWYTLHQKAIADYIARNGNPYLVHVHVPWNAGVIALLLKFKKGIKYIITEHWGIYNSILKDRYNQKPLYFRFLLKQVIKHSEHLVTPSKYLAQAINQLVSKKKYMIIPNVVDPSLFYFKPEKHSTFTFIHVSNMDPIKNVSGIIDAFLELVCTKGHESLRLILIGNRDDSLRNYVQAKGILNKNIFFKGEIRHFDVAQELQMAQCFILNSESETFSCVTAEALCCGLPVVTRNVGSLPELINSTNGLLIDGKSSLENALLLVYENYQQFNQEKIANEAQNRYNYGVIADLFQNLYESLKCT